jgi:transcriptional regulator with XRE-family HTH domain
VTINERIKEVRCALNMTQKEFGNKITLAQTYLSQIENGERHVTEKIIKIICLQFNIDEYWLRTGQGNMFINDDDTLLDQLSKRYSLDFFSRTLIETYIKLPPSHRKIFKNFYLSLMAEVARELHPNVSKADTGSTAQT